MIDDDFVLTERSCAVFMRQICEGIEFVHSQNIIHLDMKVVSLFILMIIGYFLPLINDGNSVSNIAGKHTMPDERRQSHKDNRFRTCKRMGSKEEAASSVWYSGICSPGSREF